MAVRRLFGYRTVFVPSPIMRRMDMIAEELAVLSPRTPIEDGEDVAAVVLAEFARQHFEESTKSVVQLVRQHPDDRSLFRLL